MQINEDFTGRSKIRDIGRYFVTRFVRDVAKSLPEGASLLDAGAGECAYKKFFSHCQYKAVDLAVGEEKWNYGHLDYVAPLDDLPIESESFDAVLCTQVLEHLADPAKCLSELCRVLKKGGKLYLTAPMAHREHQAPYDYFRYTSYGLRHLCTVAGFSEVTVTPFGGMFVRWAYELPRAMAVFPGTGIKRGRLNLPGFLFLPLRFLALAVIRVTQYFLLKLDVFDKVKDDPFGWMLCATK